MSNIYVLEPFVLNQTLFTNKDDPINVTKNIENEQVVIRGVVDENNAASAESIIDGIEAIVSIKNVDDISSDNGKDRIFGKIFINTSGISEGEQEYSFESNAGPVSISIEPFFIGGIDIAAIALAEGNNSSSALAEVSIDNPIEIAGLWNTGSIDTVNSDDEVIGEVELLKLDVIATSIAFAEAFGGETATAEAFSEIMAKAKVAGIWNEDEINTGNGHDRVEGRVILGEDFSFEVGAQSFATAENEEAAAGAIASALDSDLFTRASAFVSESTGTSDAEADSGGEESLLEAYGIYGGIINTGNGNDTVIAESDAKIIDDSYNISPDFGGGVNVNLGNGDDLLKGFGDAIVDGEQGFDTVKFDFTYDNFTDGGGLVSKNSSLNQAIFSLDDFTMTVNNVEQFIFGSTIVSYSDLPTTELSS